MPAFFRALEKIKPVYDWAYKIMLFICKLLLIADIIITSWSPCWAATSPSLRRPTGARRSY